MPAARLVRDRLSGDDSQGPPPLLRVDQHRTDGGDRRESPKQEARHQTGRLKSEIPGAEDGRCTCLEVWPSGAGEGACNQRQLELSADDATGGVKSAGCVRWKEKPSHQGYRPGDGGPELEDTGKARMSGV